MQRVYANTLDLVPGEKHADTHAAVESARDLIDNWARKVLATYGAGELELPSDGSRRSVEGTWIERAWQQGSKASYMRLALEHEGDRNDGRRWLTEVTLGSAAGIIEVTIRLSTGFRAGIIRPQGTYLANQPGLVGLLTDEFPCFKGGEGVRIQPWTFDGDGSVTVVTHIKSLDRALPVILVNDPDQRFVDVARLAHQVRGLATVAAPKDGEALEFLSYPLGQRWVPPTVHARIFWPEFRHYNRNRTHPLMTEQLFAQLQSRGRDPTRHISAIIHRTANFSPLPGKVAAQARRLIAQEIIAKGPGGKVAALESQIDDLKAQLDAAAATIEDWSERYDNLHRYLIGAGIPAAPVSAEAEFDVEAALATCNTAADVLDVALQQLDHIEVLDHVYKEAGRDKAPPRNLRDLFESLQAIDSLCRAFDDDGALPKGDIRQFFDNYRATRYTDLPKYASHDSKTAKQQFGDQRTVAIGEEQIQLAKHFTIGTGNPAECMHLYFEVFPEERRGVVGYCGRHLSTSKY